MADFDPDAFVAKAKPKSSGFDPDAFVSKATGAAMAAAAPDGPRMGDVAPDGHVLGDVGAGNVYGAHTAKYLGFGLGDKLTAAIQAAQDVAHDKTGKVKWGDAYNRDLAFNDKLLETGDKLHPWARWGGNLTGVLGSMAAPFAVGRLGAAGFLGRAAEEAAAARATSAAPTLFQLAQQSGKAGLAAGAAGGYGNSRADTWGGTLLDTATGAGAGGLLGFAAPYMVAGLGRGASYVGEKAKNLAGDLKVHSLHPVPTLGEKMAELPGGEAGVGRELLEQGLGGLTKKATAAQIDAAGEEASKVAGQLARAYDAGGNPPVDISPAVFRAAARAQELKSEPLTREAGVKLEQKLAEYAEKYGDGTTTAADALQLKRTIGAHVYGAKVALKNGDVLGGEYGRGLAEMQRGVDDALDSALGPKFAEANLRVRRLMGAGQAAEREAGKKLNPIGLIPTIYGASIGGAHGGEAGAAATVAAMLAHKYGYQAGASGLYNLAGRPLSWVGGQMGSRLGGLVGATAPQAAATAGQSAEPLGELIGAALRSRPRTPTLATMADTQPGDGR